MIVGADTPQTARPKGPGRLLWEDCRAIPGFLRATCERPGRSLGFSSHQLLNRRDAEPSFIGRASASTRTPSVQRAVEDPPVPSQTPRSTPGHGINSACIILAARSCLLHPTVHPRPAPAVVLSFPPLSSGEPALALASAAGLGAG